MKLDVAERAEIERELVAAKEHPDFSGLSFWLTYYLTAAPKLLNEITEPLRAQGCFNLSDCEGGFLYPKQPCGSDASSIVRQIESVLSICNAHNVEIINIDLDTSPNVERAAFQTLIEFDR